MLELFLPRVCASCGARARGPLCEPCAAGIWWISGPVCVRCGHPGPVAASSCRDCRGRDFAFRRARQAAVYRGAARDALKAFKLLGDRRSAAVLARPMTRLIAGGDLITFVPSERAAMSARGFNPAEELARPIARATGAPLRALLRKVRHTPDAATLGGAARRASLAGAFVAAPAPAHVTLIDDIFTTGATADACARALTAAGASIVDVVAFARSTRYAGHMFAPDGGRPSPGSG